MSNPKRRATYDDVRRAPEGKVAEIVDGELYVSPRPASPHARAAAILHGELDGFDGPPSDPDRPGGWWLLFEPELHCADGDVLVPDLAGWRRERMPAMPDVVGFTLAPDWVCEVVSPSTATLDRTRKMRIYAREHVEHLWLIDPRKRTLEVYRRDGETWGPAAVHGGADVVRAEPFASRALALDRLWLTPTAAAFRP